MAKKIILTALITVIFLTVTTTAFADGGRGAGGGMQQQQLQPQPQKQQPRPQPQHQVQRQPQPCPQQIQQRPQQLPQPKIQPQPQRQQCQYQRHYYLWPRTMIVPVRYVVPAAEPTTIIIWITNNNGSQTQVTLTACVNGGYLGPQGEYYATMPTMEQLKALYGLECAAPEQNSIIVYLGNVDGVERIVVLMKNGDGYIGPKGEYYQYMPDIEQLKVLYVR